MARNESSLPSDHRSVSTPRTEDALLFAASASALCTLVPVALHQLGALRHLPDPPGSLFDSDTITLSKTAHPLGVPDSLPGLASYGATIALIVAAKQAPPRNEHTARLDRVLAGKLLLDGSAALFNTVRQVVVFRKLCSWCTGTAFCTAVMVYAGRKRIARLLAPRTR